RARSSTSLMVSKCLRAATSGTTPPYSACSLLCERSSLDKRTLPSRTTAAAVSSQLVSNPRNTAIFAPSPHSPPKVGAVARKVYSPKAMPTGGKRRTLAAASHRSTLQRKGCDHSQRTYYCDDRAQNTRPRWFGSTTGKAARINLLASSAPVDKGGCKEYYSPI